MARALLIIGIALVAWTLIRVTMAHYRREALRKARAESSARERNDESVERPAPFDPARAVEARYRDVGTTNEGSVRQGSTSEGEN